MTFAPRFVFGDLDLTDAPFAVEYGMDLGNPQYAVESIAARLQQGEIDQVTHVSNRPITIPVLIEGADLAELAEAERVLMLECEKERNTFTVYPGDGYGYPTVFDTFQARPEFVRNDDEEQANIRRYTLTFTALPNGRSIDKAITTATPLTATGGTPSTTVISDGTSAAGWDAMSVVSGHLEKATVDATTGVSTVVATRTGLSIDLDAQPFVYFDYWQVYGSLIGVEARANGVPLERVMSAPAPAGSTGTRVYYTGSGTLNTLTLTFTFAMPAGTTDPRGFALDNVTATNVYPAITPYQAAVVLPIEGSAPTEGSIHVSHTANGLGDTMVYTCGTDTPAYMPNLRNYLTSSGATTTDATLVSGARNPLSTAWVATVPGVTLPRGQYALWARLRSTGTGAQTISWTTVAQDWDGVTGTDIPGGSFSGSASVKFTAANTWYLFPLGRVSLPGVLLPEDTSAIVKVTFSGPAGVDIDDGWAFNLTDGALTVVTGVPKVNLWIDTADEDLPMPSVWVGGASDRSNSYGAGGLVAAWGVHDLTPPYRRAHIVTAGAQNPTTTVEHDRRWHTHAAK